MTSTKGVYPGKRLWITIVVVGVAVALATSARPDWLNLGGLTQWNRFWAAAFEPRLDRQFLDVTLQAAFTTVAFAAAGTSLAVFIGLVGGILTSETWWERDKARSSDAWWRITRSVFAFPRGIHEAIWALILVAILGRDPVVGVLAIGIPFGAITAKVYADMLDDAPHEGYRAMRAAGAGRIAAIAYSLLSSTRGDFVSYAFYRFECAIRSAVILGIIGAGGLGFQLALSFQSLRYDEMWTLIAAIFVLSAAADIWSSKLRSGASDRFKKATSIATIVLLVFSLRHLGILDSRVLSEDVLNRASTVARDFWPPQLPAGGFRQVAQAMVATLQMSVLAIALAAGVGVLASFLAARVGGTTRRLLAVAVRSGLLLVRSIPPPVWALVLLFILFPGPLPGAMALGIYTLGILARLMSESIENLSAEPRLALHAIGATASQAFLYSTLPQVAPRMVSLSMYRWEVAIRETVIVGLVGAGGLGRLLATQNAAFARNEMSTTILAYVILSLMVDLMSSAIRRSMQA